MTDEQSARALPQDEGLASRLSRLAVSCDAFLSEQDGPTCREAAHALTAKDARIAELEARLEASQDALSSTLERLHLQTKRIAEMEGVLRLAATTFRHYAKLHFDKHTDDGDTKGEANQQLALEMESALTPKEKGSEG